MHLRPGLVGKLTPTLREALTRDDPHGNIQVFVEIDPTMPGESIADHATLQKGIAWLDVEHTRANVTGRADDVQWALQLRSTRGAGLNQQDYEAHQHSAMLAGAREGR